MVMAKGRICFGQLQLLAILCLEALDVAVHVVGDKNYLKELCACKVWKVIQYKGNISLFGIRQRAEKVAVKEVRYAAPNVFVPHHGRASHHISLEEVHDIPWMGRELNSLGS